MVAHCGQRGFREEKKNFRATHYIDDTSFASDVEQSLMTYCL